MQCIFCGKPTTSREPIEHIVEEGLVGDVEFECRCSDGTVKMQKLVLDEGEVCGACNRPPNLAVLGEYVQKQLGYLKVLLNSVGTKSGKAPTATAPGFYSSRTDDEVFSVFNAERKVVHAPDGTDVYPARPGRAKAIELTRFEVHGDTADISFRQQMNLNKRFVRGLHKIAFELLCKQLGADHVLDRRYDPIRAYVLRGVGNRVFGVRRTNPIGPETRLGIQMIPLPRWESWLCVLDIGVSFSIDLSPENRMAQLLADPQVDDSELVMRWDNQTERERAALS